MNAITITGRIGEREATLQIIDLNADEVMFVEVFTKTQIVEQQETEVKSRGIVHLRNEVQIHVDATNLAIVETAMGINTQQS